MEGAGGTGGPGRGAGGRRRGPAGLRANAPSHTQQHGAAGVEGAGETGGHGRVSRRGAWPRCRWAAAGPGRATPSDTAPLVWRAPEGPEGTGGLRGAAPNEVRTPSLAGGRALRRPEHPWGHKQHHTGTNGERAAGPSGARNTSGATSTTTGKRKPTAPGTL